MRASRLFALSSALLLLTACTQAGATAVPASPTVAPLATATAAAATATPVASTEAAPTATAEVPTEAPVTEPPVTAEPTATAVANVCVDLTLKIPGRLTLSTDIPAFLPWMGGDAATQYPNEPEGGSAWTNDTPFSSEPYSMEGFEGATAYAVAAAMGFTPDLVDWVANVNFEQAFAPGVKPFDFHMGQIAITEERAQSVTFSDPYFESNQSILALTGNPITEVTSLEELRAFRLGAAANTTAFTFLENFIAPTVEPLNFQDNTATLQALQGDTVDGIVVDLATAFYMRDAQLEDFDTEEPEGTIVGQFGPPAEPDHVGFVLELDNPLVACVNQGIAAIQADGSAAGILDEWINTGESVPFLE